jgi:adenylate cyclase
MTPEPSSICLGCWQGMHMPIPLRGVWSAPFRVVGIRPSRMNPNCCTICEMAFSKIMKARSIKVDATVMFADLRGYTALTQTVEPEGLASLLDTFYDECAAAIWRYDGILNKTLGDAVLAIFNFPVKQADHPAQALLAARQIQDRFREKHDQILRGIGLPDADVGIGIGLDCGETNFGEFGNSHRDLTAVGTVVNRAARAQAAAERGEILVTAAMRERTAGMVEDGGRDFALKGFEKPVTLFAA